GRDRGRGVAHCGRATAAASAPLHVREAQLGQAERGGQPRGVVAVVAVGREAVHLARVDARVLAGRQDRAQRQRELGLRRAAVLGPDGLVARVRSGHTVVDMSTTPVALARDLSHAFAARGADFADAPVARTAQAAKDGTLSVMVGGDTAVFERLKPYLACMGSEITHCGPVGAGQAVKLMNNLVVAQTVVALAEALAVATSSGVPGRLRMVLLAASSRYCSSVRPSSRVRFS